MASSPDIVPPRVAPSTDRSFFGHPRGLATLFFTEMWERFSYYGMRALLILFMTAPVEKGGLGFDVVKGGAIYGFYTAMVYLLALGGGWVADRITGQRRSVLYGGILISIGEFCLFTPSVLTFYIGLVLLMLGTGLLKPNVSTIVGQLYGPNDPRRDSGFSIFYMGINLGAFLSPLACGWVGQNISWRLGFAIAGLGMILGLIQYVLGYKHLGEAGLYPASTGDLAEDRRQKRRGVMAGIGLIAVLGIFGILGAAGVIQFSAQMVFDALGYVLLLVSVGVFGWLIFGAGWSLTERRRAVAILVLFIASAIFWAAYEQAGSSLTLFADRDTNCQLLGFVYPSSWFQSVQPIFVIAFAPVFAWIWLKLGRREPSSPAKFSMALLLGGLAFLLLVPAAKVAMQGVRVSMWWLTGCYLLQTFGELCLSPIGLSAMTKLAPARLGGFIMGLWFVSISIGDLLAGKAGSLFESMALPTLFGWVAIIALAASVVLALLIRPTVRMMEGVK